MHVRELTDEEDQEYQPDPPRRILQEADPVSVALKSGVYLTRVIIDECRETFPESPQVSRYPEMFDRHYFEAPGGAILVDLLDDETPDRLAEQRQHRRVEFKDRWCSEHGRRYIALGRGQASTVEGVQRALREKFTPDPEPEDVIEEPKRRGRPPKHQEG